MSLTSVGDSSCRFISPEEVEVAGGPLTTTVTTTTTAAFVFPAASGHMNPSLVLAQGLAARGIKVHYLASLEYRDAIASAGAEVGCYRFYLLVICVCVCIYIVPYNKLTIDMILPPTMTTADDMMQLLL